MNEEPTETRDSLEVWCEELAAAIDRRSSLTWSMNEIAKTNTKTAFTAAALEYLRTEQGKANVEIRAILNRLISGHR